jgi:hypothetical protein
MKKWLKYLGIALLVFTIIGVIAVATDDSKSGETASATPDPAKARDIPYTVGSKDLSGNQATYRLVVNERADKASLIEIARKLKAETDHEQVVCYFNVGVHSSSGAWARCGYLPKCESCKTDKDKDGTDVEFAMMGISSSLADSLDKLTLDTIDNKQLLCSYLDDGSKCKTELYTLGNKPSRMLMVKLFTNEKGETAHLFTWLKLKEVDGEKRYYYEEDPYSESFVEIDYNAKSVHFRTDGNTTWQSYHVKTP